MSFQDQKIARAEFPFRGSQKEALKVRELLAMPTINLDPEEKRRALDEVLQSATFFRADQLRNFLRYICEMEIEGRGSELCEALIGVEAFGRPAGYTPTEDGSVRRRALDLREKLQDVYANELAAAQIRIDLPKGRYVPRFVRVGAESGAGTLPAVISTAIPTITGPVLLQHATTEPIPATAFPRSDASPLELQMVSRRRFGILCFAGGWIIGALMVAIGFTVFHWDRASARPAQSYGNIPPPASTHVEAIEPGVSYEAEAKDNTLSGMVRAWPCDMCSGGARVRYIGKRPANYLSFNHIRVAKGGNYEMVICYAVEGTRFLLVSVNHAPPLKLTLTGKDWKEIAKASITVTLKTGENTVKFYNDEGFAPDIDRIVIR